ncbi:hypothetical protein Misp06_03023 [Microbulbifer sp. NBRC 101763]|uniref:hypothetical protein n=1 Tax=unclassified Microbulbifer TaxID=2619833 RepID=UPI00309F3977
MKNSNIFLLIIITAMVSNFATANKPSPSEALAARPLHSNNLYNSKLPNNALPLSSIITILEQHDYTPIDIEFMDDHWAIKAYKNYQRFELKVNLFSGAILYERISSH